MYASMLDGRPMLALNGLEPKLGDMMQNTRTGFVSKRAEACPSRSYVQLN